MPANDDESNLLSDALHAWARAESKGDQDFLDLAVRLELLRQDEVAEILDALKRLWRTLDRPVPVDYLLLQEGRLTLDQVSRVRAEGGHHVMLCPACASRINVRGLRPRTTFNCSAPACKVRLAVPADPLAAVLARAEADLAATLAPQHEISAEEVRQFNEHRVALAPHGFELLARAGGGGMGVVYRACQHPIDRLVAVKVLPRELSVGEQFVRRFAREAKALARIKHPNVVNAFHAGIASGLYFLVMEWVPGENLQDLCAREGAMSPGRTVPLAAQVARGLRALHGAGMIHRDVKPSNIILREDGSACLLDLGLVRLLVPGEVLTGTHERLGTLLYVSPEQLRDPRTVTPASDVYSLGATLYHLLAGKPAFDDIGSWDELRSRFVARRIPRLDAARLGLAPDLADLVERMMDVVPGRRPQDMEQVAQAMEEALFRARGKTDLRMTDPSQGPPPPPA